MFVCLPLIALILLILICWRYNSSRGWAVSAAGAQGRCNADWRSAVLSAAVIWGTFIAISTEILSFFRLLTFGSVLTVWLIATVSLAIVYFRLSKVNKRPNFAFAKLTPVTLVLISSIVFITATVGLVAVVSPPNTWDSMTYHMSRVVHWIQNRSVAHYPTYFAAQLVHPPFAEFVIMHLQILSGGDRFANLVQWFSMVGSIIGVSLIAKQLGAGGRGQILAAVFCATIPMGILQGSSTQNDYAVSFWLVCLAHFTLAVLPYKRPPLLLVLGVGASLGLAMFTKSSGYIYAFPFLLWLFISNLNRLRWKLWRPIFIVAMIAFCINFGHYWRNLDLYGNPIATAEYSEHYKIEVYSLPTFISNVIRNLSLHVDIVRHLGLQSYIKPITGLTEKIVTIIHDTFLGVSINDPRTTFPPGAYRVPGLSFNENIAGNPLHLFLILLSIALFLLNKKLRSNPKNTQYFLAVTCGFLLLCLMLKVQQFQSRHHLPAFVLFSAFVGLVLVKLWHRSLIAVLASVLIVTSMPWVFDNRFRPIAAENNIFNTNRNELYFTNRTFMIKSYFETADFVKTQECSDIGLSLGWKAVPTGRYWEYPFWALLNQDSQQVFRIEHIVHPENGSYEKSKIYPHNVFNPCLIIAVRQGEEPLVDRMMTKDGVYEKKWMAESISVLVKQSKAETIQK